MKEDLENIPKRIAKRPLEIVDGWPRKVIGTILDILFKAVVYELGSCAVGKHDIDDGIFKLPKALKYVLV
ncbi:hypothetical protein INT48_001443, partial [Thamnidium elegans]